MHNNALHAIECAPPKAEVEGSNPFGSARKTAENRQFSATFRASRSHLSGNSRQNATRTDASNWHVADTRGTLGVSHGHVPFLDAVRGFLACVVVVCHIFVFAGTNVPPYAANLAVDGFFILSGFVLARSYRGNALAFVARRVVRLWPVYAVCLTIGYALNGMIPTLPELAWIPTERFRHLDQTDKPVWTLYIEAWATPLLPFGVLLARNCRIGILLVAGVLLGAWIYFQPESKVLPYFTLFVVGIAAAQYSIRFPQSVPAWSLWLGKQAYSLYLTNWLVLVACYKLLGISGLWPAVPLIFAVSWICWWAVERPSIAWSRRVGRAIR